MLRAVALHSFFPSALPVPLSKTPQNSTAPSVILGIMGRCREAKGMVLLTVVSDPSDGSIDILEPLANFVLKHGFSALQAINLRQSSHLQCNTVKCNSAE